MTLWHMCVPRIPSQARGRSMNARTDFIHSLRVIASLVLMLSFAASCGGPDFVAASAMDAGQQVDALDDVPPIICRHCDDQPPSDAGGDTPDGGEDRFSRDVDAAEGNREVALEGGGDAPVAAPEGAAGVGSDADSSVQDTGSADAGVLDELGSPDVTGDGSLVVCDASTSTLCGAACIDTRSDPNHCGGCDTPCGAGMVCAASSCVCPSGAHDCGGTCVSNASPNSCGMSCATCPTPPNGSATCDGTSCGISCVSGYNACGGACVDQQLDKNNCGTCGKTCGIACSAGQCLNAVAVTAGTYHSCALLNDGTVRCWGANDFGELGNGTSTGSSTCGNSPCWTTPVAVSGVTAASTISAGYGHTCAVVGGGGVKCWGANESGELGDGTTNTALAPVTVSGLSNATAITSGSNHTCALLYGGSIECWGWDPYGQLGDGIATTSMCSGWSCAPSPVVAAGVNSALSVAAGYSATCAVLSGGSTECWGMGQYGDLGDGPTTSSLTPVTVAGVSNASVVVAAANEDFCILVGGGNIQCWGNNLHGELGTGSTTGPATCSTGATPCATTPVAVLGVTGASAIAEGGEHACAILSGGMVQCWGLNNHGQLGNGTTTDSASAVDVSTLTGVTQLGGGEQHTCAVLSSGTVRCWGSNAYGQLGNGTTTDQATPVGVAW